MSPLPAASSRFIAKFRRGAQVERLRACRATRVTRDSICGSLTPGRAQDRRLDLEHAARGEELARRARACAARCRKRGERRRGTPVRRRPLMPRCPALAPNSHRRTGAAASGCQRARLGLEQQDHRRAHVEASELGALRRAPDRGSGHARHDAPRGRRDVAGPDGGNAADVQRADQHHARTARTRPRTASARARCAQTAAARAAPSPRSR